MLVLTRKLNESIKIRDDITVTVIGITKGGKVKLGIDAPKSVPVHREEIYKRIQKQNEEDTNIIPTGSENQKGSGSSN